MSRRKRKIRLMLTQHMLAAERNLIHVLFVGRLTPKFKA
jgi:hypothetical protein